MNKLKITLLITAILFIKISFAQNSSKISKKLQNFIEVKKQSEYSVYIFYKDKGDNISNKLKKAETLLPENSIKRRRKLMKNKSSVVTFYDIPINESYFVETEKYISKLRHKLKWLNAISAEVSEDNINKIANLSFVKKIDIVRKGTIKRNDNFMDFSSKIRINPFNKNSIKNTNYILDYGSSLTQLEQINVPVVHDMGYHGEGVIVCLMDAGFNNLEHPAFSSMNIIGEYDFVNSDIDTDDGSDMGDGSHGTNTLSTIGGFEEGELIGPAYGANFIIAKTENTESETTVEEDNWVAAVTWAEDNYGPDVTSTSLGYITFDDGTGYDNTELDGNTATITIGADIAASLGILVVNSAGNEGSGTTTIGAPADGDSVLAVGAVTSDGTRSYFSSVGPSSDGRIKPDVMAMGSSVKVAEAGSGSGYENVNGTSFSGPLAGGVAALLVQMLPTLNNMEIIEAMKMTANNSNSPNNEYGWGILNTKAAYEYIVPQIIHTPVSDTEDFIGPYVITAEINSRTSLVAGEQKLHWRRDGGAWQTSIMSLNDDGIYSIEINGNNAEATYDYYFEAKNSIATRTLPENAPTSYFSFSTIVDNTAPVINHTSIKEYYVNLFNTAKINAEMIDNTGINLSNTYVEWFVNDVAKDNFFFTLSENNNYSANFPAYNPNIGDIIKYRIVARDNANSVHTTYYPSSNYNEFIITDRISFEQNQFSHDWQHSGNANWFVTNTEHQDGSFCMKSGDIGDNQASTISIIFESPSSGNISFYKKVSCEGNDYYDWDYLSFVIDGIEQNKWDQEIPWSQESYLITPGIHSISWTYSKDFMTSHYEDCAWIDNITLPSGATNIRIVSSNKVNTYPNPASNYITFNTNSNTNFNIEIYNQTGKLVKHFRESADNKQNNISDLKSGIYIAKLINNKSTQFVKFIINK